VAFGILSRSADIAPCNQLRYTLHQLKGARKGTCAVSVSGTWRITFRFEGGDAYEVELEDYH
jgi:plasmid maintenance system killer protein